MGDNNMKIRKIIYPFIIATLFLSACTPSGSGSSEGGDPVDSDPPVQEPISVTGVSLNYTSLNLYLGYYAYLTATVTPDNANNKNVIFSSSDSTIATVNESGEVYAKAIGDCVITAKTEDGDFKATCNVNVSQKSDDEKEEDPYQPDLSDPDIFVITEANDNGYTISGEYKQIYVNAPDEDIEINLSGATITNSENSPIYVANCSNIDISAKKGTTNTINDTRAAYVEDESGQGKGAIYVADGDLKLKGTGTLTINANYFNGVHCKDDVKIQKLTLNVTAVNHAIKGNDSITVSSGALNLTCGGDGLKSDNSDISSKGNQRGNITINGGSFNINAWGDALDASYDAIFEELDENTPISFNAKTNKYSSYDGKVIEASTTSLYLKLDSNTYANGAYTYAAYINENWYRASYLTTQGGFGPNRASYIYEIERPTDATSFVLYRFSGNNVTLFSTTDYNAKSDGTAFNSSRDMVSVSASGNKLSLGSWSTYSSQQGGWGDQGNTDKADSSAKGIKADNEVIIKSGSIELKCYDDGIHANKDVVLENGNDALGNVTISGGDIVIEASDDGIHADQDLKIIDGEITVSQSYEGIEGNRIYVEGGDITVFATDDGANAGSGNMTPTIVLTGGILDITVPTSGDTDGIDSNGTIEIDGGTLIVRGPGSASGSSGFGAFAVDFERSLTITSGTLICFGGIEKTPTTSVTKTLCASKTVASGNHTVTVGSTVFECYLKYQTNGCVVYSSLGSATLD